MPFVLSKVKNFRFIVFFYVYKCFACIMSIMDVPGSQGGQKIVALYLLGLELQTVVGAIQVIGIVSGSSLRATGTLSC